MTSPVPSSGDAGLVDRLGMPNPSFDAWRDSFEPHMWAKFDLSAARLGWEAAASLTQQQEQVEVRAWEYDTGDEWDVTTDEAKAVRLREIIPVQPLIRLTDHQAHVARLTKERDDADSGHYVDFRDHDALRERLLAAKQQLGEAREAMEPFGRLARVILAEAPPAAVHVNLFTTSGGARMSVSLSDLRRICAALNGGAK